MKGRNAGEGAMGSLHVANPCVRLDPRWLGICMMGVHNSQSRSFRRLATASR